MKCAKSMRSLLLILVPVLILAGCGKQESQRQPPPITTPGEKMTLVVFGAKYCEVCKSKFPEIQKLLNDLPADSKKRLSVKLYVTAGAPPDEHPTEEIAIQYRNDYMPGVTTVLPDLPWRCGNYQKILSDYKDKKKCIVPAAAVLNEKGETVKYFPPGNSTFVSQEIVGFAKARVKGQ